MGNFVVFIQYIIKPSEPKSVFDLNKDYVIRTTPNPLFMNIPRQQLLNFKKLYEKDTGKKLTNSEATNEFIKLVRLVQIVHQLSAKKKVQTLPKTSKESNIKETNTIKNQLNE